MFDLRQKQFNAYQVSKQKYGIYRYKPTPVVSEEPKKEIQDVQNQESK